MACCITKHYGCLHLYSVVTTSLSAQRLQSAENRPRQGPRSHSIRTESSKAEHCTVNDGGTNTSDAFRPTEKRATKLLHRLGIQTLIPFPSTKNHVHTSTTRIPADLTQASTCCHPLNSNWHRRTVSKRGSDLIWLARRLHRDRYSILLEGVSYRVRRVEGRLWGRGTHV